MCLPLEVPTDIIGNPVSIQREDVVTGTYTARSVIAAIDLILAGPVKNSVKQCETV